MESKFTIINWCILLIAPFAIKVILLAVFIYIAYLLIKALKIYINKNRPEAEERYRQYYEAEQDLEDLEAEINSKADTDWSKEP